jgi:t-SNARE complex subunit (syntaxin)
MTALRHAVRRHKHIKRLAAVVHSITMLFILLALQPPPR